MLQRTLSGDPNMLSKKGRNEVLEQTSDRQRAKERLCERSSETAIERANGEGLNAYGGLVSAVDGWKCKFLANGRLNFWLVEEGRGKFRQRVGPSACLSLSP